MNNERIKWLDDFNNSLALARSVASSVDRNGEILTLSGNVVMGERLEGLANVLGSALDGIDAAISAMVSEARDICRSVELGIERHPRAT